MPGRVYGRMLFREAGSQETLGGGVTAVDGRPVQHTVTAGVLHAPVSQCQTKDLAPACPEPLAACVWQAPRAQQLGTSL